jgi:HD superfamily phosphodiesterase
MKWNQFIERLFELAEPYVAVRRDYSHIQVAHQYSLKLLSAEGGDRKIVEPAVILHDVGWSKLSQAELQKAFGVRASSKEAKRLNRVHEVEGSVLASRILQSLNYGASLIEQIVLIIERHDSGVHPESLEEKIVKDSDKLWRFSNIGFWTEAERQGVEAIELYTYLKKKRPTDLFCATSRTLAEEELVLRAKEIKEHSSPCQ